jgi:hypothetical protein
MGPPATHDEVAELLGDAVDDSIIDRIVLTGASVDDIADAIEDVEHEVRFDERRMPTSTLVAEVRSIIEELPFDDEVEYVRDDDERIERDEGIQVVDGSALAGRA